MSDADGFLARWSRRKVEAQKAEAAPDDLASASAETASPAVQDSVGMPAPEPFDLSSLPSIETVTATTDISAFLRAGVPESLRNAALRRAWQTDPAIRDYVGPADYDWDFHTPGALAGHGDLAPDIDIKSLIDQFTNALPASSPVKDEAVGAADAATPDTGDESESEALDRSQHDAMPRGDSGEGEAAPEALRGPEKKRRHGGALPR